MFKIKKCRKCKREFPHDTDHYFKKCDTKDGFSNKCKECHGSKFTDKLTKPSAKEGYKHCIKCDRELPAKITHFPPDVGCTDGLRNVCRECGKDGHFMNEDYVPKKWWTCEEESLLVKMYPHHLNEELIDLYFPYHSSKELSDKVYRINTEKGIEVAKTTETIQRTHILRSQKMSGENAPHYGKTLSFETRMKISKSKKGKYVGENSPLFNIPKSEEHKKKISTARIKMGVWKGNTNPRHSDPLNKERNGRWKGGISELYTHLRRHIRPWKEDSMRDSNYKCLLTGDEFDNVHHLFNFSHIMKKTIEASGLPIHEQISSYSFEELELIEKICMRIHYELGLGVCLRQDVHKLFHDLYGYRDNSPEQFEEYKRRYMMKEFDCLITNENEVGERND